MSAIKDCDNYDLRFVVHEIYDLEARLRKLHSVDTGLALSERLKEVRIEIQAYLQGLEHANV